MMLRAIILTLLLALPSMTALAQRAHIDPQTGELMPPPVTERPEAKIGAALGQPIEVEEFVADDGRRGIRVAPSVRHHLRARLPIKADPAAADD